PADNNAEHLSLSAPGRDLARGSFGGANKGCAYSVTGAARTAPPGGVLEGWMPPSGEEPTEHQETDSAKPQEHPVVEWYVCGKVADVMNAEQVVIDHAFDQVEDAPSQDQLAREGHSVGEVLPSARVTEQ